MAVGSSTRLAKWKRAPSGKRCYPPLPALGGVQDDAAEVPKSDADLTKTAFSQELGQLRRRREFRDRAGKIVVGVGAAGDCAADVRQNVFEIEAEEGRHGTSTRFAEFKDPQFASPFQNAGKFAKTSLVIGEIAEAESCGDEVEAGIGEREVQGVGSAEDDGATAQPSFLLPPYKHRFDKIGANDRKNRSRNLRGGSPRFLCGYRCALRKYSRTGTRKRQGQVTRTAAQIENARVGPLQNGEKSLGRAPAPEVIERKREQMIEKIVARRDPREHVAYASRGLAFIERTLWPGAGKRRWLVHRDHR